MSDATIVSASNASGPRVKNRRARRVLVLIIIALILLLGLSAYLLYSAMRVPVGAAGSAPVDTNGVEWVRSIYGTGNRPEDLFGQTQAAVPGSDGAIWITDVTHQSSIMQFGPDGRYRKSLESVNASMPISSPSRMAVGPDGKIYICETALDRVQVLTSDGKEAGTFSVPQPISIAVNEERIAVGSVSGFAVLDLTGKPIGVFGSRGKGPDQFDYVHGVAFGSDGSIYVADSYNNRLSAYEPNGKRRWMIRTGAPANSAEIKNNMLASEPTSDTVLKGADMLQLPLGLTVDGSGRIVVADMYDCTMAVFEPKTGKFIGKYGDAGAADGQFFYPVSVSYDSGRDWFTVADALNRRVQIIRIPGSASGVNGLTAVIGRQMSGPLRACLFPLLLLIALALFLIVRSVRRGRSGPRTVAAGDVPPTNA